MSLLQADAVRANDASSHGDDLAKGSSNLYVAAVVAFVTISAALLIFFWIIHTPPVAAGEVTHVWFHPMHTLSTPVDAAGVVQKTVKYDRVFVFGEVRVRNQSDKPIVLKEMTTNITFDDGIHASMQVSATDYDRIFIAYPELASMKSKALLRDTLIAPGEIVEGSIVSSFQVTKAQWDIHKDMNFVIDFQMHPSLILQPKGAVVEK